MRKIQKIIIAVMLLLGIIMLNPSKVQAGLQANKGGTSLTNVTADGFFEGIRAMESSGGTLGKSANYNTSDFLDTSGNGIDCHMAKNTEWGTAAMLAASSYGATPTGDASSTQNESGVYQMADKKYEYVATSYEGATNKYNRVIRSADGRYFNLYSSTRKSFFGDSTEYVSASLTTSRPVYARGYNSLFNVFNDNDNGNSFGNFGSRAVVVCGERTLDLS